MAAAGIVLERLPIAMLTSERWAVIERIFHDAVERPAHARHAFVRSNCAADSDLRREVDSLLQADAGDDSHALLAARIAAEWIEENRNALIGRNVGGYRVLSLLGAGGMGEVFLAEDLVLGRRVALKLLPVALESDSGRLRQFVDGMRAAASLNHPNVITVHHVGLFEGRRYVVTEYIGGETVRDRLARGRLRLATRSESRCRRRARSGRRTQRGSFTGTSNPRTS